MVPIFDSTPIPRGSSLYYALLYAEPQQKAAVAVLRQFYREVKNIVDIRLEPHVALMKLSWWSSEIDKTYRGAPQHPITQALYPLIQSFHLPEEWFQYFLEGIKIEIGFSGFEKTEEFFHFLQLRAGIDRLLSQIVAYPMPSSETFVLYFSLSLQIIDLIRFFGKDARRGVLYFPQDDLQDLSITQSVLDKHCPPEILSRLLSKEAERAKMYYEKAIASLNTQERYAQCSMLMLGNIQITLLDEMIKDNFPVLNQKISLTPLRKFWIAWRTYAKEKKRCNKTR